MIDATHLKAHRTAASLLRKGLFLADWTAAAGADNFSADPPNAALSVYEAGKDDSSVSIIEITSPRVEGADIL